MCSPRRRHPAAIVPVTMPGSSGWPNGSAPTTMMLGAADSPRHTALTPAEISEAGRYDTGFAGPLHLAHLTPPEPVLTSTNPITRPPDDCERMPRDTASD